jgi:SAM-dependent methyltransferase
VTGVFDVPTAYEVAFSYRDVAAEADALLAWHGGHPKTVLELAAGPGDHALEFARRGFRVTALDLSPAMCARVAERAAAAGLTLDHVIQTDMCDFSVDNGIDLAFCLIDSLAYVLSLDHLVNHLACVRASLTADGAYVVETQHPADGFRPGSVTDTEWTSERDGVRVHIRWGNGDEPMDPLTQVSDVVVSLEVDGPDGPRRIEEVMAQRFWTRDEIVAAARLAGLTVAAQFGDFGGGPLDGPRAWRMISVLRRA